MRPRSRATHARPWPACRRGGRRGGQRVDHRVLHRGRRPDRARLADPLRAERVERRRRLGVRGLERRELRRARHRVVDQLRRERVAVGVVDDLFPQRLRRCPTRARRAPGPSTSSGLSTVPQSSTATCRTSSTRPVSVSTSTTAMCAPNGNVAPSGEVELAEQRLVSFASRRASSAQVSAWRGTPATPRPTVVGHDVLGRGLEQARRERAARSSTASLADRRPAHLQRTRPTGTTAPRHDRGVGLHELDPVERDAERVGDDHRERGGVALPVRRRADPHGRAAVLVDLERAVSSPNRRRSPRRTRRRRARAASIVALATAGLLGPQVVIPRVRTASRNDAS